MVRRQRSRHPRHLQPSGNPNGTGVAPNLTAGALTTKSISTQTTPSGTSANGLNYNVSGTTGVSGDRALGTSPTGTAAMILELSLTNSTGSAINALSLSYDIDRLTTTTGNNSAYSSSPTVGLEENPGYQLFFSLNNGSTWTNVSSLNPTLSGPGGVVVPNSVGVTNVSDPLLNLGSAWAAGSTLKFAWVDDNAQSPSPDQLLGLNNVSISAAAAPEPNSAMARRRGRDRGSRSTAPAHTPRLIRFGHAQNSSLGTFFDSAWSLCAHGAGGTGPGEQ